jgi:putative SOS response-associated peptidase YedK
VALKVVFCIKRRQRMCNGYRNRKSARRLVEAFSEIKLPLRFSNGIPNIEPRDDIKITERAPNIVPDGDGARLEMMRWSWPSPKGAPVFNFRSENRTFERAKRCLIPADGFYEFTPASDPKSKRKDKWLFTMKDRWDSSPRRFLLGGRILSALDADPGVRPSAHRVDHEAVR